jgi:hypothetical protein
MCPHTTLTYVSSYYSYICVLIRVRAVPAALLVYAYYFYMCPHTCIGAAAVPVYVCLYMCPHTTLTYVSSYACAQWLLPLIYKCGSCYKCVLIKKYPFYTCDLLLVQVAAGGGTHFTCFTSKTAILIYVTSYVHRCCCSSYICVLILVLGSCGRRYSVYLLY